MTRRSVPLGKIWIGLGALASVGAYLVASQLTFRLGFPLDDAWIHQTYARSLAEASEWAFRPGQTSAGSTAPLWTTLLAVGRSLGLDPLAWTYLLGAVCLVGIAAGCRSWLGQRSSRKGELTWLAAALVLLEWHLVWGAASGMETLAQALVAVLVLWDLEREPIRPVRIGALIGIGVWIRPDALSLLVPLVLVVVWRRRKELRQAAADGGRALFGLGLLFVPYLIFNDALGGSPWPSTFYAKQAEYAVLREAPLPFRLIQQLGLPLVGMGVVLTPGFGIALADAIRRGAIDRLAPAAWALSFLGAYALRLPVTYQHGRYAIPVIPVLVVLGLEGLLLASEFNAGVRLRWVLSRAWVLSVFIIGLAFWALGARAYSTDVAIIETEMVETARWIRQNTEPDALVAAHDIGALGYFGDRELVDLAGLVSPEVIAILRDEPALAAYLDQRGADYLMTFPGWYPQLVEGRELLYASPAGFSPSAGGENMAVYRWRFARLQLTMLYSPQSNGGQ